MGAQQTGIPMQRFEKLFFFLEFYSLHITDCLKKNQNIQENILVKMSC